MNGSDAFNRSIFQVLHQDPQFGEGHHLFAVSHSSTIA